MLNILFMIDSPLVFSIVKVFKLKGFEARDEETTNAPEHSQKYDLLYEFMYDTKEIMFLEIKLHREDI